MVFIDGVTMSDDVEYYLVETAGKTYKYGTLQELLCLYLGPRNKDLEHVMFNFTEVNFIVLLNPKTCRESNAQIDSPYHVLCHFKTGQIRSGYITEYAMEKFRKWNVV